MNFGYFNKALTQADVLGYHWIVITRLSMMVKYFTCHSMLIMVILLEEKMQLLLDLHRLQTGKAGKGLRGRY
jgi:hypothetical protein